jgi:hypothetical protein
MLPETSVQNRTGEMDSFKIIPNPLAEKGKIVFRLEENTNVSIELLDMLGRKVMQLADGEYNAGSHEIDLPAESIEKEVYLVRYTLNDENNTKLILVR